VGACCRGLVASWSRLGGGFVTFLGAKVVLFGSTGGQMRGILRLFNRWEPPARAVRHLFFTERRGGARSAHTRSDNCAGDCAEERGGRGRATLRHGCAGDCAGRSGRTERDPARRAERSLNGRGAYTPRRTATGGSGGEGGRGGGGWGPGLRAGVMDETNRLRAQRTGKTATPGHFSAAARGARPRWPSGPNNERRRARRAEARATPQLAPLPLHVERARGDAQRTPSVWNRGTTSNFLPNLLRYGMGDRVMFSAGCRKNSRNTLRE
jgi:hypothetical protein